jgi:ubiquinone biosynthesis protein
MRLIRIIFLFKTYDLIHTVTQVARLKLVSRILLYVLWWVPTKNTRQQKVAVRFRLVLEHLGPVFIKFGQLLSTRPDVISPDFIAELVKLQNKVPPFSSAKAKQIIERSLNCKLENIFSSFDLNSYATASIAQVHKAVLLANNQPVAVKVLRPNIKKVIDKDIKLLRKCAWLISKLLKNSNNLRLTDIVEEFKNTIYAELNFLQDAANATKLANLHANDNKIIIPRVFHDYCSAEVMVLQWMDGTPINDTDTLRAKGIDLVKLSYNGVKIFYTQVFDYGFFHADMHPGNILCSDDGKYIALDFGIVGSLSDEDKRYLAINLLAFFSRDYKTVAQTHINSGWTPPNTSVEELEIALRTVCEPIFNKPLAEISFGQVLIKLFQVSRQFNIVVQPQLLLLQKTIVNVEGMGRMLNPNLDLWHISKPILENWVKQQMGIGRLLKNVRAELPYWSYILPILPRKLLSNIEHNNQIIKQNQLLNKLLINSRIFNSLLLLIIIILIIILWHQL